MPSAHVLFRLELDVEANLFAQLSIGGARANERAKAGAESLDEMPMDLRLLRDVENELDGLDVAAPTRGLGADGAAAGRGESVVLGAAVVLGRRQSLSIHPRCSRRWSAG